MVVSVSMCGCQRVIYVVTVVCGGCSVELMSALVSCSNLLVIQIETDVYSMLRKVVYFLNSVLLYVLLHTSVQDSISVRCIYYISR